MGNSLLVCDDNQEGRVEYKKFNPPFFISPKPSLISSLCLRGSLRCPKTISYVKGIA